MWKARRCAVLGPTLGRRDSSWISSSRAPGSWANALSLSDQARRQAGPGGQLLHGAGPNLARAAHRLVHRRDHQVLQHLDVARDIGIDNDGQQLLLTGDPCANRAAAGGCLDLLPLEI